ncbi:neurofilament light polypeptide-like protein [Reticulomyxa filosa]|uniref:Neurofilament light polypeptide-like protein n=1 Tax=Reticulomyxa filosa TaxID=46433 RepID=X6MXW7_RETFI|nr:neurofilament light polypeptide-like protein [Reticulomyxa filosa]|eukprot:ETO18686.1 neurofilament light polypeptide-like protein [Reticulomyxa filosa]
MKYIKTEEEQEDEILVEEEEEEEEEEVEKDEKEEEEEALKRAFGSAFEEDTKVKETSNKGSTTSDGSVLWSERVRNGTVIEHTSNEVALPLFQFGGTGPADASKMVKHDSAKSDESNSVDEGYSSSSFNTAPLDSVRSVGFVPFATAPPKKGPLQSKEEPANTLTRGQRSQTIIGSDPQARSKNKSHNRSQTQTNGPSNNKKHHSKVKAKSKAKARKRGRSTWSRELDVLLARMIEDAMTDSIVEMYQSIKNRPNASLLGSLEHKLRHLTDNHSGLPSQFKQMIGNALDSDIEEQGSFKE